MNFAYHLQEQFETLALAKFEKGQTLHSTPETRLTAPIEVTETYAVDAEDLKDKTYHVISWLLPQASDIKLRFRHAFGGRDFTGRFGFAFASLSGNLWLCPVDRSNYGCRRFQL